VQILETGADSPEIVGCSGLSHYFPLLRLVERSGSAPAAGIVLSSR
jgi:hypothetical protein